MVKEGFSTTKQSVRPLVGLLISYSFLFLFFKGFQGNGKVNPRYNIMSKRYEGKSLEVVVTTEFLNQK